MMRSITLVAYHQLVIPALTIWREARGLPDAMLAVAWVIRNRCADPRWPDTPSEVCLQPKQFSCFNAGDPNAVKLPGPGPEWAAFEAACAAWESHEPDPTSGANHYHSLSKGEPSWAWGGELTLRIGAFKFYLLRG